MKNSTYLILQTNFCLSKDAVCQETFQSLFSVFANQWFGWNGFETLQNKILDFVNFFVFFVIHHNFSWH